MQLNKIYNFIQEGVKTFISDATKTRTFKQSSLVFSGAFLRTVVGFITGIFVIRILGPFEYGSFAVAATVLGLLSALLGLGFSGGVVKCSAFYLKTQPEKVGSVFKTAFYSILLVGVILAISGIWLSKPLALHIFHKPYLEPLIKVAFIAALGGTLYSLVNTGFQTYQKFVTYTLTGFAYPVFRLIGVIGVFFLLGGLSAHKVIILDAGVYFLIFFLCGSIFIAQAPEVRRSIFTSPLHIKREIAKELFAFSKWIFISQLAGIILAKMGVLMLASLSTTENVGYYNSAAKFILFSNLAIGSLGIVLLPKVSALKTKEEIISYIKRITPYMLVSSVIILFLVFVTPIVDVLIPALLGEKYIPSISILKIIVIAECMRFIANPIYLSLYPLNKVNIMAYLGIVKVVVSAFLYYILIPRFGAIGVAYGMVISRSFNIIISFGAIYKILSRKTDKRDNP